MSNPRLASSKVAATAEQVADPAAAAGTERTAGAKKASKATSATRAVWARVGRRAPTTWGWGLTCIAQRSAPHSDEGKATGDYAQ